MRAPMLFLALSIIVAGCSSAGQDGGNSQSLDGEPSGTSGVRQTIENPTGNVTVTESTGGVDGRVFNENGAPVRAASVVVLGAEGSFVTNGEGRFEVGNLTPGAHIVRLDHPDYRSLETEIKVEAAKVTRVEIVLISFARSDAGYREHFHDLWGDQTTKVVFDGDLRWRAAVNGEGIYTHTWVCVEPSPGAGPVNTLGASGNIYDCNILPIVLASGTTILPGTKEILVKASWKASDTLRQVKFTYVPANDTKQRSAIVEPGKETRVPIEGPMTDHGHARHTLWSFAVDARPALGPLGFSHPVTNEQQIGPIHVTMTLVKGDVLAEPSHKHYWVNGSEVPLLVDHEVKMNLGAPYTRDPTRCYGPPCVALPADVIVPPGTTRLVVSMKYGTTQPTLDPYLPRKTLAFRTSAIPPALSTLDNLRVQAATSHVAGHVTYELALEPLETDAFYQTKTLWGFYIAKEGEERESQYVNECNIYFAGNGCGSNWFRFTVTAFNDDWTADLAG